MNKKTYFSESNKLLHERDAADILACSIAWLQKSRYLGTGPRYVRVGGPLGRAIRYRASDLQEYINSNLVETIDSVPNNSDEIKRLTK